MSNCNYLKNLQNISGFSMEKPEALTTSCRNCKSPKAGNFWPPPGGPNVLRFITLTGLFHNSLFLNPHPRAALSGGLSMHTSCLKQICSLYSAKSVFYLRVSTPSVPETGRPKPKTDTRFVVTAWSWLFCPGFPVSGTEGVKHYAKPTKLLN